MNLDRNEMAEGARMARRALGKPEPDEKPKTQADRRAEWLAAKEAERQVDTVQGQSRQSIDYTKRHLGTPGAAFSVGEQRYAADGTLWKRTA